MALTDLKSKTAKPKNKPYKLFDAEGLYLYVPPSGRKVWRFKYRFNGKECLVTIGKFPNKKLKEARKARNQYLLMLDEGKNPAEVKRLKKNPEGMSFKEVAQEWIDFKVPYRGSVNPTPLGGQGLELALYSEYGAL